MKTIQNAAKVPNTALWRARRRSGLERKQAAWLLGHKNPDPIARYERGETEPSFDNAIRLSIIYEHRLEELFPFKYASFRNEMASRALTGRHQTNPQFDDLFDRINICSYEDALHDPARSADFFPHVRDHVTKLAKLLAGL